MTLISYPMQSYGCLGPSFVLFALATGILGGKMSGRLDNQVICYDIFAHKNREEARQNEASGTGSGYIGFNIR